MSLFSVIILIGIAQAVLDQCDETWSPEININKIYNNWTTFTKSARGISFLYYNMKMQKDMNVVFAWNMYSDEKFSKYKRLKIYQNGKSLGIYTAATEAKRVNNWSESNQLIFKKGDNITWEFLFTYSGDHQVRIAFPPEVVQSCEEYVPNKPPEPPEILSGPNEGFNDSVYRFSVRSKDPEGNQINYTFDWGDGTKNITGPIMSGGIAIGNHSWNESRIYDMSIIASDEMGSKSFQAKKIRILWLVKVPSGAALQSIINNLFSNTTILLEGNEYPVNLLYINKTNVSNINIRSNNTRSKIISLNNDSDYAIGLEQVNNITIEGLNVTGCLDGIYIENCTNCKIINNNISFTRKGISILGGQSNIVKRNYILKENNEKFKKGSAGLSVESSLDDIIDCNTIEGLQRTSDCIIYINKSTFKHLSLVSSVVNGIINDDECCCNYTNGKIIYCSPCVYLGEEHTAAEINKKNCSLDSRVEICNSNQ